MARTATFASVVSVVLVQGSLVTAAQSVTLPPTPRRPVVENLGVQVSSFTAGDVLCYMLVDEGAQGSDVNGDGDMLDEIAHVYDARTGTLTSLGLPGEPYAFVTDEIVAYRVVKRAHVFDAATGTARNLQLQVGIALPAWRRSCAFKVVERRQNADLNGDGDMEDNVLHFYDAGTDSVTNFGLDIGLFDFDGGAIGFYTTDSTPYVYDAAHGTLTDLSPLVPGMTYVNLGAKDGLIVFTMETPGDERGDTIYDATLHAATFLGLDGPSISWPYQISRKVALASWYLGPHAYHRSNGVLTPVGGTWTGLASAADSFFLMPTTEVHLGYDANGDGDLDDELLQVSDIASGAVTVLPFAIDLKFGNAPAITDEDRRRFPLVVSEAGQGNTDLNGDGDADDWVLAFHDAFLGRTTLLGLALPIGGGYPSTAPFHGYGWHDHLLVFQVGESEQNQDLDGNGTIGGTWAANQVTFVHNAVSGRTYSLRTSAAPLKVVDDGVYFTLKESAAGVDLNGDGDVMDSVLHFARNLP